MTMAHAGNGSALATEVPTSVYEAVRCVDAPRVHHEVGTIDPDAPLFEAVNRMWWRQRGVVAVTQDDALVGCLSEDDVLRVVHESLRAHGEEVHAKGASLLLWDDFFADLRVADAMSPIDDLAVVDEHASLLEGVRETFRQKSTGARRRYIFVTDVNGRAVRVVSMRDICRYLIAVYDGSEEAHGLAAEGTASVRRAVRETLDLSVGVIRAGRRFGHDPVSASIEDLGASMIEKMWTGQRGYVLVEFFDGAPQGICTRRDVLRALRRPHCRIRDLAVSHLMSAQVKSSSRLITLGGVFKLMAIGGYRHMPLLGPDGGVECVLSMWEGVSLFASS